MTHQRNVKTQRRRSSPVFAFGAGVILASTLSGPCAGQTSASKANLEVTPSNKLLIDPVDQQIRREQARVARDPDFWDSFNRLAAAYAQKARETGDISYFELAEAALQQSLKLESTHEEAAPAWTQLAAVHLAEHRFREAGEDAERAIALNSRSLGALPFAGDAQLEMGNYEAAQKLYNRLVAPADDRPHPGLEFLLKSHGAGLHWIQGKVAEASDDLKRAIDLARQLQLPGENVAWTEFMLGEQYFQSGDLAAAERAETASLIDFPRYHRALAAMGQIRAAQKQYPEAITFYKKAIAIIPLPVYIAALGDLYTVSNNPAEAKKQYALVEYIGKLSAINQQVFNRELATFYADHDLKLPEALALAQKELEVRRDIYTYDTLAWTLFKCGRREEARAAIDQAMRIGTQDALLEYHAGMIYAALQDHSRAAVHLQRALTINPRFHVLFADRAVETLAMLQTPDPVPSNPAAKSVLTQ